jgi:hypothetical protein
MNCKTKNIDNINNKDILVNNCDWFLNFFLLILLYYLFKKNNKLGLITSLIILVIYTNYKVEPFTETLNYNIDQKLEHIDIKKINYNIIIDPLKLLELEKKVYDITKLALKDKKLKKLIDKKTIEIYREIKNNDELKMYLKFMNLINNNCLPIFINECEEVLLSNKIKIILVTLPK